MVSDHPAQVLALLRSGCSVEIGGPLAPRESAAAAPVSSTRIILGFAAIYLIWGSTYLGIRYAVATIPPLLMMGIRHSLAGAVVYAWMRARGVPAPQLRQWGYALVAGAMLFLGGHGILAWAEQKIPSGLAALLCATLPLWTVLIARVDGTERKLGLKAWSGVFLGFAGVALLVGPDFLRQRLDLLAVLAGTASSLLWAIGTSYARRVKFPSSTAVSAAMQMMSGGVLLLLTALLAGETSHLQVASITPRSFLALAYLIVFGSIIAFSVYVWLLTVSSPSRLSTYAYVNPVVAVFLGWALAGEPLGIRTVGATAIILLGVALVSTRRRQTTTDTEPDKIDLGRAQEMAAD